MRDWVVLKVKPLDVVLFRDCRPFSMGEQSFASTLSFPMPSAFAGALRRLMGRRILGLKEYSGKWRETLGTGSCSKLRFTGPLPVVGEELLLPVPGVALVERKKAGSGEVIGELEPYCGGRIVDIKNTSLQVRAKKLAWVFSAGNLEPASGFIDAETLLRWIKGESLAGARIRPFSDFAEVEIRTMNHLRVETRTAKEKGGVFTVHFLRLKEDAWFLVAVEKGAMDDENWGTIRGHLRGILPTVIRLGGEARLAEVSLAPKSVSRVLEEIVSCEEPPDGAETCVRVALTPTSLDPSSAELGLVWGVLPRPITWRGRDGKGYTVPRTIYPAGSVFEANASWKPDEGFRNLGFCFTVARRKPEGGEGGEQR